MPMGRVDLIDLTKHIMHDVAVADCGACGVCLNSSASSDALLWACAVVSNE